MLFNDCNILTDKTIFPVCIISANNAHRECTDLTVSAILVEGHHQCDGTQPNLLVCQLHHEQGGGDQLT